MASRFTSVPSLLKTRKLAVDTMVADGNCFYRAVAAAYYKDVDMHHMLRRTVIEHMIEDAEEYKAWHNGAKNFTGILNANKRLGVWNSDLADIVPLAVTKLLGVRLEIYSVDENDAVTKYVFGEEGEKIRLLYQNSNHYDVLRKD
jgi:hypothetical protein